MGLAQVIVLVLAVAGVQLVFLVMLLVRVVVGVFLEGVGDHRLEEVPLYKRNVPQVGYVQVHMEEEKKES